MFRPDVLVALTAIFFFIQSISPVTSCADICPMGNRVDRVNFTRSSYVCSPGSRTDPYDLQMCCSVLGYCYTDCSSNSVDCGDQFRQCLTTQCGGRSGCDANDWYQDIVLLRGCDLYDSMQNQACECSSTRNVSTSTGTSSTAGVTATTGTNNATGMNDTTAGSNGTEWWSGVDTPEVNSAFSPLSFQWNKLIILLVCMLMVTYFS
jgi:hypothetical protein